jgi:hypothetical protein
VYFQLTINYCFHDGSCISIKYHISSTVLYLMGHCSFSFVKNTLVLLGLLQFIQNNVNWKTDVCPYWETLTQIYSLNITHHVSFIKIKALIHLIRNIFHYADMTGGITILSSEILSTRLHESAECVRDLRCMFSLNGFARWG